jgi:hypothetical protein
MGAGAAGAAVIDAWGTANAPAKRAKMTVVYFIVMAGGRVMRDGTARLEGIRTVD